MSYAVTLNDIQKRLGADNAFTPIIEVLKQSNPRIIPAYAGYTLKKCPKYAIFMALRSHFI